MGFAAAMMPFTLLRFGGIGVGELIFALVMLQQLSRGISIEAFGRFWMSQFWMIFLAAASLGFLVNLWVLDQPTSTPDQVRFDFLAYIFVLASCLFMERLAVQTPFMVQTFASAMFFMMGAAFTFLFLFSRFADTLLGLPLTYFGNFVPLAENLHQVSMTLVPMPFIGIAVYLHERQRFWRLLALVLIPLFAWMALSTGSAKAVIALVVGLFALAYSAFGKAVGGRAFVVLNLVIGICALAAISVVDLTPIAERLFADEDIGGTRSYLYAHGVDIAMESPLVGHGPGPHVHLEWSYVDAHQSLLTVFLQAGLIGVIAFLYFICRIFLKTLRQPALFAAFAALMVYATGGDILRRLPAWICIFVVIHYAYRDSIARRGSSATGKTVSIATAGRAGLIRMGES